MRSSEHGCRKCSVNVVISYRYLTLNIGNIEFVISASILFLPITYFSPGLPASANGLASAQVSEAGFREGTLTCPSPSSQSWCLLYLLYSPSSIYSFFHMNTSSLYLIISHSLRLPWVLSRCYDSLPRPPSRTEALLFQLPRAVGS